jgi:MFS family permease
MPFSWINRDGRLIITSRSLRLLGQGPVMVLLVIYLDLVGFTLFQTGMLVAAGLLGGAFYTVLTILLGDVIGRRRLLTLFTFFRCLTGIALALFNDPYLLICISFATGFSGVPGGGGALQPLGQATLAETAPPERRNELYAIYNIMATSGSALGALASGLPIILQNSLELNILDSYKFMMIWYALFSLIATILNIFLSRAIEVPEEKRHWMNPLKLPSRRKIFTFAGLFAIDHGANSLVIQGLVAFWFFTKFQMDIQSLALIFFASSLGAASSFWVGAKLANRIGLVNTMVFTRLPAGILLISLPFIPHAGFAIAIWLAYTLTKRMAMPMRQSYTMAIVEPQERVPMATVNSLTGNSVMVAGPPIATLLWTIAASVPFVIAGCMQIVSDLLLYTTFRQVQSPEEIQGSRQVADTISATSDMQDKVNEK